MEANPLESIRVGEAMHLTYGVEQHETLQKLHEYFIEGNYNTTCIIDKERNLVGVLSLQDVNKIPYNERTQSVMNYVHKPHEMAFPEETLSEALYKMAKHNLDVLPVLSDRNSSRVVGQISRTEIIKRMHK